MQCSDHTQGAKTMLFLAELADYTDTGLALSDALFVKLYLADMSHFAAANAAYCRHFPTVSPSARACVQVSLPSDTPIMLDVLLPATAQGMSWHGIRVYIHMTHMSHFALLPLSAISPSARACVQVSLLRDMPIMLDALLPANAQGMREQNSYICRLPVILLNSMCCYIS